MPRKDPRVATVVDLLPADGSKISHPAWMELVRDQRDQSLIKATQLARRAGEAVFEIGDMSDPIGTLTVRRAFVAAAPAAAPVPAPAPKLEAK